jgi:hypothetical protein
MMQVMQVGVGMALVDSCIVVYSYLYVKNTEIECVINRASC